MDEALMNIGMKQKKMKGDLEDRKQNFFILITHWNRLNCFGRPQFQD
jgi:hypothetical protein